MLDLQLGYEYAFGLPKKNTKSSCMFREVMSKTNLHFLFPLMYPLLKNLLNLTTSNTNFTEF